MSTTVDRSRLSRRSLLAATGAAAATATLASFEPAQAAHERAFASQSPPEPGVRPNMLVILADDLGWADLSCYGAPVIRTPQLDRLAASGVRYVNGYSASSVCSPTRFSLYTGRFPGRLPGGLQEPIMGPSETDGIPIGHPTLASMLRDVGYATSMIGKWHCGFLPWFSPTRLGWDEFFGSFGGGLDYFSKVTNLGTYDLYEQETEHDDLRYYTDIVTERAAEFIHRDHRAPWLLNLNFTTPHWPWEGPEDQAVSDELTARTRAGDPFALLHFDGGSVEKYQEMVQHLDLAVGQVLQALARSGQRNETLVLFASDNGGERFSFQWPLDGEKGEVREGGIRVPTLLRWPRRIRERQVDHTPVSTMDWTATLLELGGAHPPPDIPLDGVSLVDHIFRGGPPPERDLFWRMRGQRALRRHEWKYVRQSDGVDHLYDLAADQREQADLARKAPDVLASLRSTWEATDASLIPYPS